MLIEMLWSALMCKVANFCNYVQSSFAFHLLPHFVCKLDFFQPVFLAPKKLHRTADLA